MAMKLVIETDIFDDVDDVGALALAHALADEGRAEITAVFVNTPSRWGHLAVKVVNRAFGRPEIPVGLRLPVDDNIAENDYAKQLVARFGSPADSEDVHDAVALWRDVLDSADEQSLVLVSLGFYDNLVALLDTVDGELIRRKISHGAVMGGRFPNGVEFNFAKAPALTQRFLREWPTPLDFLGWEMGTDVESGRSLTASSRLDPVSSAYRLFCGPDGGRPSWDPMAVALAVDAEDWGLTLSEPGSVSVDDDGHNVWRPDRNGTMRYVSATPPAAVVGNRIDTLVVSAVDKRVVSAPPPG
ncbi:nucleoside hydrolase [Rathayibacter sp. KR2-224]|uniref:nucleoside hydrolase n=1 Tax=Rathayibacter sp. KR2-224 TaxID=3400913 RepID=UPI003C08E4F7